MNSRQAWWNHLDSAENCSAVDGLVRVPDYVPYDRPPDEVVMMEKARKYGADAVFFEAGRNGKPPIAQAFIFVTNRLDDDLAFAKIHKKLWSWGGVPLVYRKLPGQLQLFRCAHGPDFVSRNGDIVCRPAQTLLLASAISNDPWWDIEQLRNGTLWNDTTACKTLLSARKSAHKSLVAAVKQLSADLNKKGILPKPLRRRLIILSLLIAYLEQRKVFEEDYFGRFLAGANRFFEVLANGAALVKLLRALEIRFNGNVFSLSEADQERLSTSHQQLIQFSRLIEGRQEAGGQLTLWELYSFKDLPVELISHIYQLFVTDADSSVYTPPFLVRLMLEESLSWERLDRLCQRDEIILDPSCGSGVFLVEAYKRLVVHWRSRNNWQKPDVKVLKSLLQKVHGIDLEDGAVELAAFSLCLALCDALEPEAIRASIKLFPPLAGKTLHHSCFFAAKEQRLIKDPIGVMVGNPPFASTLNTQAAERSYKRYKETHGDLPDKQIAYLFLHEAMEMVTEGGTLSMLQQYNFLYNQKSLEFRRRFFAKWDIREVLDFISVRGLFQMRADTKIVVVVAESALPPDDRKVLHATFRRTGRVDAEQGFDIDYYDMHWLPRKLMLTNDAVWRADLLGGGRVLDFIDRVKQMRTLGEYANAQGWDYGEGFIEATPKNDPSGSKAKKLSQASHLTGKPLLPSNALTAEGIDWDAIAVVEAHRFKSPYTAERFTAPMTLVHQQFDLNHAYVETGYLTYKNQIVGFCGKPSQKNEVRKVDEFIREHKRELQAFVAGTSVKLFTQHATTLSAVDVVSLPYPKSGTLGCSENERIVVDDVVDYYRDLVRLGEDSSALKDTGHDALADFSRVFCRQISGIYKKNPLLALEPQVWPGVICQPFVFGTGKVNWSGADELKGKLDSLFHEQQGTALHVSGICRIYDKNFIFLLKPDQLRYWLRSVALRDADETLVDLRAQGF